MLKYRSTIVLILLISFSLSFSLVLFANRTFISKKNSSPELSFVVLGHIYPQINTDGFDLALEKIVDLKPDFIIFTGDMVKNGTLQEWDLLEEKLKVTKIPYYFVPGNHDVGSSNSRNLFIKRFNKLYFSFVKQNNLFVTLSTTNEDYKKIKTGENGRVIMGGYEVDKGQVNYFKNALQNSKQYKNVFIFTHHPLWLEHISTDISKTNQIYDFNKWNREIEPLLPPNAFIWAGDGYSYAKSTDKRNITRIINGFPMTSDPVSGRLIFSYVKVFKDKVVEEPVELHNYKTKIQINSPLIKKTNLPVYQLLVYKKNRKKLDENLPYVSPDKNDDWFNKQPMSESSKKYVNATFIYQNKVYDVNVRYRGDFANHWRYPQKSWVIRFTQEDSFYGTNKLKLFISSDRYYFADAFHNYRARKLGLLPPDTRFVLLFVNNDFAGVYYQIEDWDKKYLETKQRISDSDFLTTINNNIDISWFETITANMNFWEKNTKDPHLQSNFAFLDYTFNLLKNYRAIEIEQKIFDILDEDSFYSWHIHSVLSKDHHQNDYENLRLYFNNTKGKFELIPWDVEINKYKERDSITPINNIFSRALLMSKKIRHKRNILLWNYLNSNHIVDDLAYYDKIVSEVNEFIEADLQKVHSNTQYHKIVGNIRKTIVNNANYLKEILSEGEIQATKEGRILKVTIKSESDYSILKFPCLNKGQLTYNNNLGGDLEEYSNFKIYNVEDLPVFWSNYIQVDKVYDSYYSLEKTTYNFILDSNLMSCVNEIVFKNNVTGGVKVVKL